MSDPTPDSPKTLKQIAEQTRYPMDAFHFVRRGLDHTVQRLKKNPQAAEEKDRHVSGQELCHGLRDYALEQYGLLARTLLRRWNLNRTEDFGHIVFAMVDGGLMHATEHDSIRDFSQVYDFDEAFASRIPVENVPFADVPVAGLKHE
ncbi:MAG: Minf_1886 family protein [Phycisphaeraceae bacterium]